MNSFTYPTDQQIIDGLANCIESLLKVKGPSSPCPMLRPPPNIEQLKELMGCAFGAGLETEESRRVSFTVAFCADRDHSFPYRFKERVPLAPRDLTRIAVAIDASRSAIGVVSGESCLQIAGLMHLGEQHAYHGQRLILNLLSIRVLGPAIFLIRYGSDLLLTYRRGRFAFHHGPTARFDSGPALHCPFGPTRLGVQFAER